MATITGQNNVDDRLEGTTDMDTISGLSGNDNLIGGAGKDTLYGGDGNDFIDTAGFAAGFDSRSQDDIVDGGAGTDMVSCDYSDLVWEGTMKPISIHFTFTTGAFQIQIDGYVGASISNCEAMQIALADGNDNVTMGDLGDYVYANGGKDTVNMGGGDDYLSDTTGKFTFDGGSGIDTVVFHWFDRTVDMSFDLGSGIGREDGQKLGDATGFEILSVESGSGNDTFTGGQYADTVYAGNGNNTVSTLNGDDTIYAGTGTDTINAGGGNDHVTSFDGADTINAGDGDDYIDAGKGIDTVYGGSGNDYINGGGGFLAEADQLFGGSGDDEVHLASNDAFGAAAATVDGGGGKDTLFWTGGFKSPGKLDLSGGSSGVPGGGSISGFEIYHIEASQGDDKVTVGKFNDFINGFNGDDMLTGNDGNDILVGGQGKDKEYGGAGGDTLYSYINFFSSFGGDSGGANTLDGGDGDDTLYAIPGDNVFGGDGHDKLSFAYSFNAGVNVNLEKAAAHGQITGIESVEGTSLADTIVGTKGKDDINGSAGIDTLNGSKGNDTIWGGGQGADDITLGHGKDTLVLFSIFDEGDVIHDFVAGSDHIRLDAYSRVLTAGDLDPGHFLAGHWDGATLPTATIAGCQLFYDTTDGQLYVDWDGTGFSYTAKLMAVFDGAPGITAADFTVSLIG